MINKKEPFVGLFFIDHLQIESGYSTCIFAVEEVATSSLFLYGLRK